MGKTRIAKDQLVEKLKEELGIKEKERPKVEEKKEEKKEPQPEKKVQKPGKATHPSGGGKPRSKKYQEISKDLDRSKTYPIPEAVDMIKKLSYAKFNATLEAHINTTQTGIRGLVSLPFASGKTEYKTEPKAAVIHLGLGKLDQPNEELAANIKILLQTLGKSRIKKVTLSPTMGPSVKVDLASL